MPNKKSEASVKHFLSVFQISFETKKAKLFLSGFTPSEKNCCASFVLLPKVAKQ